MCTNVLVIVDMQTTYPAAGVPELCRRIEAAARAHDGPLVAVNFDEAGASTVDLPEGTPTVWKGQNDGGSELYAFMVGAGLNRRDVRITLAGVNTAACVYNTACGLSKRLSEEEGVTRPVRIDLDLCGDANHRVLFVSGGG